MKLNQRIALIILFLSTTLLFNDGKCWAIDDSKPSSAEEVERVPIKNTFNKKAAKRLLSQGIKEVVFIKRLTLDGNHFYTEYVNSTWLPGGNICVLNLETGQVRDLVPQLNEGVFNRFDISYDAGKVIFDYKKGKDDGYRIYEVNIDGTGLRQLTFPQKDEKELVDSYGCNFYHHGTDDMHPCYLPDGGIAFVSTRCQYGILCNAGDIFTTKVMYRMDADGKNMQALSNNSVSEAAPSIMPDGRILYHRWEYVDKAAGNAKCLWAMRADGSASVEVYGNTLTQPETLIYARTIPGAPSKILSLATTHCCPNNGMGTVVIIDTEKNLRTKEPLSYVTKDVDARTHNGFHFKVNGKWIFEKTGESGRLFKDPYPISEQLFLVSHKPKGYKWNDPKAYDLYVLNEKGEEEVLYMDENTSCWHAFPLVSREVPPILTSPVNPKLAEKNVAECIVTNVYVGMPEVERGTVKYLRIMEQVPRPWTTRNRWKGDRSGMAHSAIGISRLGLKVQHGVVPVEKDGSAYFEVPANKNIFFQALDENFMAVQTERTFVNYMPGETRSCIGCHETRDRAPDLKQNRVALAIRRKASKPMPQPGDVSAKKVINYTTQVQPVFDKHCVSCHGNKDPKGSLNLTGTLTKTYSVSYENLMKYKEAMGVPYVGEFSSANEDRGSADISYKNAYHSGAYTSPLITVISNGCIPLRHPMAEAVTERLVKAHKDVKLTQAEFVNVVNWLDSFGQFYPSYWGLKNKEYKSHKYFRPDVTFEDAVSREIPENYVELYNNPPTLPKTLANKKK
ncbi:hypothetical protein EYV94_21380 [Puteibacter caeruleilacunae]|nr:hypothetical protein EYV94_21380 [Puteibacter caeruleilacunae]